MIGSAKKLQVCAALLAISCLGACGGPDVGVSSEEILIGTWTPLTGPASHLSTIARGMEAYFDYINSEGGLNGRALRLIIKDDGYDPERTPEVVKELVEEDRVFAILGGNGTANCLAVKDYMARRFIPWINPGSGARAWTTPIQAHIFSIFPAYTTEGKILTEYALNELSAEKFGLFSQDDTFGREGQEGVRLALRGAEKELAVSESYQVGQDDFAETAQKFKEAEIDALFIWTIPEGASGLVKALAAIDFHPQILASQILSDNIMFDLVGESWDGAVLAIGVPDPSSDEPGVVRAREILAQHGADVPWGSFALMGMTRAEVLVEGIRRAGPELTRPRLIFSLDSLDSWTDNLLGTSISFNKENHQGLTSIRLIKAESGDYQYLTDWVE